MKIIEINVLNGPNRWSNYRRKLIQMKLDLQEFEYLPTNKIPGFNDRLKQLMPSLHTHECSEDRPGGFFERMETGTWLGHVAEHIALELQSLAGMRVGYGRTRSTQTKGVYFVVFEYEEKDAGLCSAREAVKIIENLADNKEYDLMETLQKLRELRENERLGPSTASIVNEAKSRKIPWIRLADNSLIQLGYGKNQKRFQATITGNTSSIGVGIAGDKMLTKKMLMEAAIPVPHGIEISDPDKLGEVTRRIGFPVVLKPVNGNHGKGTTIGVNDLETAIHAFEHARKYSRHVLVEKYIEGFDFRLLVINHQLVAAAKRIPAQVTGDGIHTIQQLITLENTDPRRGYGHENVLTEIKPDRDTMEILAAKDYTLETILKEGEIQPLKTNANLSTGGTSIDCTDDVHPGVRMMAERISRIIGLDICGIDIMAPDLKQPLKESGGAVLEVNAAPGFRMHLNPSEGLPRNVAAPVVDMLYPPGQPFRIPIIAVTGTNGKTTTTRLIAHILKFSGLRVGFTTSDGIYIQNRLLEKGDTTGPLSAGFVLKDPTVEFAVLETARGGILRSGLGYDHCDMAVLTNITEDHLGLKEVHTLRDLARVKKVVLDSVKRTGWCVLNAEDLYSMRLKEKLHSKLALFSIDPENPHIRQYARQNRTTCVLEDGYITIKKGDWKISVADAAAIPLTYKGKAGFMIENILAATLAAHLHNIPVDDISAALMTFIPSPEVLPGRMNIFKFRKFRIMIDYAHNQAGFEAIEEFLKSIDSPHKVGIIAGVGDRRDEDIRLCGEIAARMFDHIIIRNDQHLRGREAKEAEDLLIEGIQRSGRDVRYEIIPKEKDALRHAFSLAREGTFITALSEVISNAIELVQKYMREEEEEHNAEMV